MNAPLLLTNGPAERAVTPVGYSAAPGSVPAPPPSPASPLSLDGELSARVRQVAARLNLTPGEFMEWQFTEFMDCCEQPGFLRDLAADAPLVFPRFDTGDEDDDDEEGEDNDAEPEEPAPDAGESLPVLLSPRALERLRERAAAEGCAPGELAARLLEAHALKPEGGTANAAAPGQQAGGLRLKARQRRRLSRAARLLGIEPKRFLRWQLADVLKGLEEPDTGTLADWTRGGLIRYATPQDREAARERVDAWRERQRMKAAKTWLKRKAPEAFPAAGG